MRRIVAFCCTATLVVTLAPAGLRAQEPRPEAALDVQDLLSRSRGPQGAPGGDAPEKKYKDFAEVTRGAEKISGLFTLHRKDNHLYAEIRPSQLDQPLLAPMVWARGMAQAGIPLNDGEEMVLMFRRRGDNVQLVRRNIRYKAPKDSPLEKAVKQNYTDSILMALPILSINPAGGQSLLIDLADIFLTDFARIGLGPLDRSRTGWHKIKAYPNNLELQVEATFAGSRGGEGVADPRGTTVVLHYSLVKLPDPGYKPRAADDRVGHFLNTIKDFGSDDPDTPYVRYVNRWRLEKADPKAKLSPPKKQVVWYIEDNVPLEYRPFVQDGILEWNKAFEKIGFRDALAVRWAEPGRDEFDPEDVNYCTFRWITTARTYAMSGLRSNPLTGEMIDGDVIFDASWIRAWKTEYALLTGKPTAEGELGPPLAVGEVISPILADKQGFGLPGARLEGDGLRLVPSDWTATDDLLARRLGASRSALCQVSTGMQAELGLAAVALAAAGKAAPDAKLPDELIGQLIKEVVMHEVGHSLGLRHNFRGSTMLTAEELADPEITRVKGMSGSVMDYNPLYIAPEGRKQGDFISTTLGPYDYWAIEYAYRPIDGDEKAELAKIAARSPEAGLAYGTDEDKSLNHDPLVNTYDLGADPCEFARDRMALAAKLLKDLDDTIVKDGESWARARRAFSTLLRQWGNAATLIAAHVGGQTISRDHKGEKGHDPITPIPGPKQREALTLLVDQILSDHAFRFSPELLRRLANPRWMDWSNEHGLRGGSVDFPVHEQVLGIQKIALGHCLDGAVLARIQNQELMAGPDAEPLKMSEVFRALTDGIWSELAAGRDDADARELSLSSFRRNLQREHLRRLSGMVLGDDSGSRGDRFLFVVLADASGVPADARSLARLHLKEIGDRLARALEEPKRTMDDTTRAHLAECRHRIAKVLDAGIDTGAF